MSKILAEIVGGTFRTNGIKDMDFPPQESRRFKFNGEDCVIIPLSTTKNKRETTR